MSALDDIVNQVAPPSGRGAKLSAEMEHRVPGGHIPLAEESNIMGGLRAGFADDIDTRIRQMARARFPDEPNPERRYGVYNGAIVFVDDAGTLQREGGLLQGAAEAVSGGGLPAVGATIGGLVGGAPGAALGGAAGAAGRKMIGNLALGEPQTAAGNAWSIGKEGALSGLGWKGGELLNDWRNAARARDITPAATAEAARMRGLAGQYLGDEKWLTPGEAGNIPSLQRQQTMLQMSADKPGDIMGQFNRERAGAVTQGVENFIGQTPNTAVVGRAVSENADDVLRGASDTIRKTADPYYTAARQSAGRITGTDAIVAEIDKELVNAKPPIRSALRKVRDLFFMPKPGGKPGEKVLDDSIDGLYQAKLSMDAMLEGNASSAVDRNTKRLITDYKTKLMTALETQSADISKGAGVYRTMSPAVEEMRKGIIGVLSETKPEGWSNIAKTIFSPAKASPDDVRLVRSIVQRKDPRLWQDFVRSYWRDTWESVPDKTLSAGARWRDKVFGTPRARQIWQAALGKDDFKTFSDFMDVLEATGRVSKGQSITYFAQEEGQKQAVRAAPLLSAAEDVTRLNPFKMLIERAKTRLDETVAEIITSKDAMAALRQLREVPVASQRAAEIVVLALVRAGAGTAEGVLSPAPPNRLPAQSAP